MTLYTQYWEDSAPFTRLFLRTFQSTCHSPQSPKPDFYLPPPPPTLPPTSLLPSSPVYSTFPHLTTISPTLTWNLRNLFSWVRRRGCLFLESHDTWPCVPSCLLVRFCVRSRQRSPLLPVSYFCQTAPCLGPPPNPTLAPLFMKPYMLVRPYPHVMRFSEVITPDEIADNGPTIFRIFRQMSLPKYYGQNLQLVEELTRHRKSKFWKEVNSNFMFFNTPCETPFLTRIGQISHHSLFPFGASPIRHSNRPHVFSGALID